MLARNETIFKWTLYTMASLLCVFVQGAVLQRIVLLGVLPFLYPLLAVIPATYEQPVPATVFALCTGVFCDLLLPTPIPCFYTLVFPVAGLCASLLSQSILPAGYLCSFAAAAAAFLLTDGFHCFLLWAGGQAAWGAGLSVMAREMLLTLPLVIPVTLLYRGVYRRTHLDD